MAVFVGRLSSFLPRPSRRLKASRPAFVYFLALVLTAMAVPARAHPAGDLAERFLTEAPPRWAEYWAFAEGLHGTVRNTMIKNGKISADWRLEYNHNAHCRSVIEQCLLPPVPADSGDEAFGLNPSYAFWLKRKAHDRPWVLTSLEMPRVEGESIIANQALARLSPLRGMIQMLSTDLPDLVSRPSFRVLRAVPVQREGEQLVQIDYDNTHPLNQEPAMAIQSGTMVLDPARSWCVREYQFRGLWANGEAKVAGKIRLSAADSKYPLPESSEETSDPVGAPEGRAHAKFRLAFDLHEPAKEAADDEFTLTAFGLPEPFGARQTTATRWWLWAAIAGVTCLVGGLVFRRATRRV